MAERMSYRPFTDINLSIKTLFISKPKYKKWIGEQNTKLNKDITIGIVGLVFLVIMLENT